MRIALRIGNLLLLHVLLSESMVKTEAFTTSGSILISLLQTQQETLRAKSILGEGLKYLEHARYQQAIEAFNRALELDATLVTARYDLGVAHFSVGHLDEARQAF